jgi:ABC-type Mn2+/Zn2+ transport system ATPase subunit
MYVARPIHEKSLSRALKRNSHTLIFGESGNGKSWLYKKVLYSEDINYVVANCANASRIGSLTQEICKSIISPGTVKKLGKMTFYFTYTHLRTARSTLGHLVTSSQHQQVSLGTALSRVI